jgi:hypothetical protein
MQAARVGMKIVAVDDFGAVKAFEIYG